MDSIGVLNGLVSAFAIGILAANIASYLKLRQLPGALVIALWSVFLVLLLVEMWAATVKSFTREAREVSSPSLLTFMLLPVAVTVMAALLAPEGPTRADTEKDPYGAFTAQRYFFFGILLALPVVSIGQEALSGAVTVDWDLGFRLLVAAGSICGLLIRGRRADTVLVVAMMVVIVSYIFVVFPELAVSI